MWILLVVVAVLATVLLVWVKEAKKLQAGGMLSTANRLQWMAAPSAALAVLQKQVGKPDLLDSRSGGMAVWYTATLRKKGVCFDRLELHDEQLPHDDHIDFLYGWMDLDVPEHMASAIQKLSSSAEYDPVAKRARMRCDDLNALVVTFVMMKRVATGQLRHHDAQQMLKPWIIELKMSKDPVDFSAYNTELCKYKDSLQYR